MQQILSSLKLWFCQNCSVFFLSFRNFIYNLFFLNYNFFVSLAYKTTIYCTLKTASSKKDPKLWKLNKFHTINSDACKLTHVHPNKSYNLEMDGALFNRL
jgi:hypothetical protein